MRFDVALPWSGPDSGRVSRHLHALLFDLKTDQPFPPRSLPNRRSPYPLSWFPVPSPVFAAFACSIRLVGHRLLRLWVNAFDGHLRLARRPTPPAQQPLEM